MFVHVDAVNAPKCFSKFFAANLQCNSAGAQVKVRLFFFCPFYP